MLYGVFIEVSKTLLKILIITQCNLILTLPNQQHIHHILVMHQMCSKTLTIFYIKTLKMLPSAKNVLNILANLLLSGLC